MRYTHLGRVSGLPFGRKRSAVFSNDKGRSLILTSHRNVLSEISHSPICRHAQYNQAPIQIRDGQEQEGAGHGCNLKLLSHWYSEDRTSFTSNIKGAKDTGTNEQIRGEQSSTIMLSAIPKRALATRAKACVYPHSTGCRVNGGKWACPTHLGVKEKSST